MNYFTEQKFNYDRAKINEVRREQKRLKIEYLREQNVPDELARPWIDDDKISFEEVKFYINSDDAEIIKFSLDDELEVIKHTPNTNREENKYVIINNSFEGGPENYYKTAKCSVTPHDNILIEKRGYCALLHHNTYDKSTKHNCEYNTLHTDLLKE